MPIREYVYDAADEDARRRTVSDAQSQGSNSVYAHSDGSSLHFVEAGNKTGSADVYDKLVERCNAELSKAVLGRTSSAISASTPKADLFRKALDMGLPIDDDYIYEQLGIEKPADYAAIKKDLDEKDVLPNLRWVPSTAAEPNAEHRAYWNTVLPVNHPFWSQHKPGDRWDASAPSKPRTIR